MNSLGRTAEDLTAGYYRKLGFRILERNYIFPKGKQVGEIDLVVLQDKQLVFVEVKARTSNRFGSAFEAVDQAKQRRLVKTAKLYLSMKKEYQGFDYRIDVAAVDIDNHLNPVIILANAIEDID